MLQLRDTVRAIPGIHSSLRGCQSGILRAIESLVNDERLGTIEALLARSLNEDAGLGKVNITC